MTENKYQAQLIKRIQRMFPDCFVLKADPGHLQGIPDLLILWHKHWASLEVKPSLAHIMQPNQQYYIERLSEMSYAAVICPENEEEVLSALQQAFESPRGARVS